MMFVDAMRRYLDRVPEGRPGGSRALRDLSVGEALTLMHEDPSRAWTVEMLGDQVGLSRSALHERFVRFLDQAPMQYLASWRMQLAATRLVQTRDTIPRIGLDVGYDSEAAFSRASKRIVGVAPSEWRRSRRGEADARGHPDRGDTCRRPGSKLGRPAGSIGDGSPGARSRRRQGRKGST